MVVHWHLTFFSERSCLLPYACLWGKCWEFQMTSPQEPLGQCCSNFIWNLPGAGEWKIAKLVAVHWPRWQLCPYMVKTFKNLLLQYRGCLIAETLHNSSGTGGLPKMLKWWSYNDIWPFTVRSSLLLYAIVWAPYICMKKMLIISNDFSSEASGPVLLKFHIEILGAGERKIAKMGMVHWSKWLPCPYMVKTFKNLLQNQISPGP